MGYDDGGSKFKSPTAIAGLSVVHGPVLPSPFADQSSPTSCSVPRALESVWQCSTSDLRFCISLHGSLHDRPKHRPFAPPRDDRAATVPLTPLASTVAPHQFKVGVPKVTSTIQWGRCRPGFLRRQDVEAKEVGQQTWPSVCRWRSGVHRGPGAERICVDAKSENRIHWVSCSILDLADFRILCTLDCELQRFGPELIFRQDQLLSVQGRRDRGPARASGEPTSMGRRHEPGLVPEAWTGDR